MAEIAVLPASGGFFSWINRFKPQTVFVLVAGFFGIIISLVTPPIQVPDEPNHWFRVYQLTQGKMLADHYGGDLPVSIDTISNQFGAVAFNEVAKTSPKEILRAFDRPLQPRVTRFFSFPNTALYSIFPYAPQTLTMFIARKLHWPALALLYAGRIGTVLGYVLIGWGAIRITPILKWPACMILTTPMSLFLAASVSADPITLAMVFLATAVALRCILSAGPLSTGMILSLALVMIAATLCKSAYFEVVFLVLAIPREKWGSATRRWVLPAMIILLTLGAFAGWSSLAKAGQVKERGDGPGLQLQWILHHPKEYAGVIRLTITTYWSLLVNSAVGLLGWVDTPLSQGAIDFLYIAMAWVALAYDEPLRLGLWPRVVAAVTIIIAVVFIITANYMVWNAVGFPVVEGMQGRYFLPIGLLICVVFRRHGTYTVQPKWMLALLSCISMYTIWVLIERYYLTPGILWSALSGT